MFQRLAFDYCVLKHHNTKCVKLYSRRSQVLANTLGCLLLLSRTSALNLTEGFLDVGVGRVTVQVYREVVHPRQMQEHRYQSPFRSLKRRHWHGANVLHWEMDILTLVITHLTKWPQNGYTDACDYTSYKVAAKNINSDKSSQSIFG